MGVGQRDLFLDSDLDEDLAHEYDTLVGVRVIHRCEMCRRQISAEESMAYGIGYDCAAELGRETWARMRRERELAEREGEAT